MFEIEDEAHAKSQGAFHILEEALAELKRRASMPWDCMPNRASCTSWRTCGRRYEIVEYQDEHSATVRQRLLALEMDAKGVVWNIYDDPETRAAVHNS